MSKWVIKYRKAAKLSKWKAKAQPRRLLHPLPPQSPQPLHLPLHLPLLLQLPLLLVLA